MGGWLSAGASDWPERSSGGVGVTVDVLSVIEVTGDKVTVVIGDEVMSVMK